MTATSKPTDGDLLGACRAGDPDAFGVFYTRYCEVILGYLARRVRDPEVAADLMAETFANALDDLERIAEISEATDVLRDLEGSLSEPELDALKSRLLDEEPYQDLAKRLRCSEAVVRQRVSRAKAHLRAVLGASNV